MAGTTRDAGRSGSGLGARADAVAAQSEDRKVVGVVEHQHSGSTDGRSDAVLDDAERDRGADTGALACDRRAGLGVDRCLAERACGDPHVATTVDRDRRTVDELGGVRDVRDRERKRECDPYIVGGCTRDGGCAEGLGDVPEVVGDTGLDDESLRDDRSLDQRLRGDIGEVDGDSETDGETPTTRRRTVPGSSSVGVGHCPDRDHAAGGDRDADRDGGFRVRSRQVDGHGGRHIDGAGRRFGRGSFGPTAAGGAGGSSRICRLVVGLLVGLPRSFVASSLTPLSSLLPGLGSSFSASSPAAEAVAVAEDADWPIASMVTAPPAATLRSVRAVTS